MLKDRFLRIMLVVIAVLLALNWLRPNSGMVATPGYAVTNSSSGSSNSSSSTSWPSTTSSSSTSLKYKLKEVGGYKVTDLKDVVVLGDGKSFVVSNTSGFMVYQVEGIGQ